MCRHLEWNKILYFMIWKFQMKSAKIWFHGPLSMGLSRGGQPSPTFGPDSSLSKSVETFIFLKKRTRGKGIRNKEWSWHSGMQVPRPINLKRWVTKFFISITFLSQFLWKQTHYSELEDSRQKKYRDFKKIKLRIPRITRNYNFKKKFSIPKLKSNEKLVAWKVRRVLVKD